MIVRAAGLKRGYGNPTRRLRSPKFSQSFEVSVPVTGKDPGASHHLGTFKQREDRDECDEEPSSLAFPTTSRDTLWPLAKTPKWDSLLLPGPPNRWGGQPPLRRQKASPCGVGIAAWVIEAPVRRSGTSGFNSDIRMCSVVWPSREKGISPNQSIHPIQRPTDGAMRTIGAAAGRFHSGR